MKPNEIPHHLRHERYQITFISGSGMRWFLDRRARGEGCRETIWSRDGHWLHKDTQRPGTWKLTASGESNWVDTGCVNRKDAGTWADGYVIALWQAHLNQLCPKNPSPPPA